MTLPKHVYSVSDLDISIADDRLLKYRSEDRRRAGILGVLEEDWRCSRLVLGRVLAVVHLAPGDNDSAFLRIMEHGLEQYERTITHGQTFGLSVLRFRDGFRYAVFVEAIITKTAEILNDNPVMQSAFFGQSVNAVPSPDGTRRKLYNYFVPAGMQQYFTELEYEDGIVGHCLDYSDGSPLGR